MSDKRVHHPLAYCTEHGLFAVKAIAISEGVRNVGFQNISTNCPKCQRTARVLDGVYDAHRDRLNVLLSPSVSPEIRRALMQLIDRVQRQELTVEDAKTEAAKLNPKLAKLFDFSDWSSEAKATLIGAIIVAAATILASKSGSDPTRTEFHIHQTITQTIQSPRHRLKSSTSLVPIPKPRPRVIKPK